MNTKAKQLNQILPKLEALKEEILTYYEDKIKTAYLLKAGKDFVDESESVAGKDFAIFVDEELPIETGSDALAAIWIGMAYYTENRTEDALHYFQAVQDFYTGKPELTSDQEQVFLNTAASVCYAELGQQQKAAELLAKNTHQISKRA